MEWSPNQDAALKAVDKWYRDGDEQVFRLFGYAGTGKTTLAKHLAENTGGRVAFAAYTGKAASVLASKGCPNASTIHSLIYIPYSKSTAKLRDLEEALRALELERIADDEPETAQMKQLRQQIEVEKGEVNKPMFMLNPDSEVPYLDLLIIDECSMVGEEMGRDLLSFGTKILVLGDPAQLPPVASGGFFTDHEPDHMLTDIHRQAENDPIIHLATLVRNGKSLSYGDYGLSRVMAQSKLTPELPMAQDQLIVGRNATRHNINRRCRELLGFDPDSGVAEKDKVVCLRNNHDLGLMNGTLWEVLFAEHYPDAQRVTMQVKDWGVDTDFTLAVESWEPTFYGDAFGTPAKSIPYWDRRDAEEFDYGYALTCHKSQGSQWDNVMVFDESGAFRDDAKRWLYTAITRAAKAVTVVV